MSFKEYTCLVSTYRPVDLGYVELKILQHFFENESPFSVYQLFKLFRQEWELCESLHNGPNAYERLCKKYEMLLKIRKCYYDVVAAKNTGKSLTRMPASYKNTHKRVKRLAQLKLIEEIKGKYGRGASYYRISTYGRIAFLASFKSEDRSYITSNRGIVLEHLLFQFFEKKTIDSFSSLKEFPTSDIGDYLHDCCSITIRVCKEFWAKIEQYQIDDILPSDEIIQQYMSYLDGKDIDQSVLNKIKKYEKKLSRKYKANDSGNIEKPPFPLLDIYYNVVLRLRAELETRIKSLAYSLVTQLGEIVNSEKIEDKEELEEAIESGARDYSLRYILADKKFFELVKTVKEEFDKGFKQFSYYR